MASTNKTPNLGLNQWLLTDPFQVEDFNADNAKLDAVIGALVSSRAKIACGSYVGTGVCNQSNPNVLQVDFTPKVLVVTCEYHFNPGVTASNDTHPLVPLIAIRGMQRGLLVNATTGCKTRLIWGENSITLYPELDISEPYAAFVGLNQENTKYYYAILG